MANVKISALSTLPGNAVSGNDLFLISQTANLASRSLSISNARIAISDANDYTTYSIFVGAHSGSNTAILNLQGGMTGANTAIADVSNQSNNNAYITWLAASANDGTTLGYAYSNDYSTYSIFAGAFNGSNTRLSGFEANVTSLQTGLSGTNNALSDNIAIFSGAFVGSNNRLTSIESNVISLQSGLIGSNTAITNLQTGLSGSNTAIINLQSGLTGANTFGLAHGSNIANLQVGLSGSNTAILNLQSGLTGANTNISTITGSPVTFQSDVTIRGNLTLTGNTTIVSANTISFGDSLLSLAANNTTSDNLDIGLYGHYWNGSANSHTGIFRSAISKDWMIFSNYVIDLEGNSSITISNSSFTLGNLRIRSANASQDVYAANAILSTSIYSNGVELRSNDYATYLIAKGGIDSANTSIVALQSGLSGSNNAINNLITGLNSTNTNLSGNVAIFTGAFTGSNTRLSGSESNILSLQSAISSTNNALSGNVAIFTGAFTGSNTNILNLQSGIAGSNTAIINLQGGLSGSNTRLVGAEANVIALQGGLSGTNTTVATKDSLANVYATYLAATSNDYVTYTRLNSNINSVQSNLTAYAAYANATFSTSNNTPASVTYVVSNYTTTAVNSYPIGAVVSSVNNVSIYLNGVYQNKNQYILSNSSSNIQFTDPSLASSLSLEIVTIR